MKRILFVFLGINMCVLGYSQSNLFSEDEYNNNWLYIGLRLGGSSHFYQLYDFDIPNKTSFDFAFQFTVPVLKNLGVQIELIYTNDVAEYNFDTTVRYGSYTYPAKVSIKESLNEFIIPIFTRINYDVGIFNIAGLAGPYFTIPNGQVDIEENLTFAWYNDTFSDKYDAEIIFGLMIGINFGIKMGPGILFADIRYAIDNDSIKIDGDRSWHRTVLPFSIGYQIGIIKK
jgi:hypothetical protein